MGEGRFYNWDDQANGRRVAFLGTNIKKQLFAARPAVGETIHINSIPYTVIGVMESKDQNSSYDGWDVDKVFIPFSAIMRDFPDKPPSTPHNIDRLLVTPKSLRRTRDVQVPSPPRAGPHPQFRPERQGSSPHLGHGRKCQGFLRC